MFFFMLLSIFKIISIQRMCKLCVSRPIPIRSKSTASSTTQIQERIHFPSAQAKGIQFLKNPKPNTIRTAPAPKLQGPKIAQTQRQKFNHNLQKINQNPTSIFFFQTKRLILHVSKPSSRITENTRQPYITVNKQNRAPIAQTHTNRIESRTPTAQSRPPAKPSTAGSERFSRSKTTNIGSKTTLKR